MRIFKDMIKDIKISKIPKLIPNEQGHQLCPYCHRTLVPVLREWMKPPVVTDYICHHCQIGFKIKLPGIEKFMTIIKSQSRLKNE